jgi:hypothetical protein
MHRLQRQPEMAAKTPKPKLAIEVMLKGLWAVLIAAMGWLFTYTQQRDAKIAAVATILGKIADATTPRQEQMLLFALASYGQDAVAPMSQMVRAQCRAPGLVTVDSGGAISSNAKAIENMAEIVASSGPDGAQSVVGALPYCDENVNYQLDRAFDNSITREYPISRALSGAAEYDPALIAEPLIACVQSSGNSAHSTCAVLLGNMYGRPNPRKVATALLASMYYEDTQEWNVDAVIAIGKVLYGTPGDTAWIRQRLAVARKWPKAPVAAFDFAIRQKWSPENT